MSTLYAIHFQLTVIFTGIFKIYSQQHTEVFLTSTIDKICLSDIEALSFEINVCQEESLTLYTDFYNPYDMYGIISISPQNHIRNVTELFIVVRNRFYSYYKTLFVDDDDLPNVCNYTTRVEINWQEDAFILRLNSSSGNGTWVDIFQGYGHAYSYLKVSSKYSSQPGRWRFDFPKTGINPIKTDNALHLPGTVCPLNSCNYSADLSLQNCGLTYDILAPLCDSGIVYLPYEWCQGYETCGKALTIMGCFSTDDICQCCNVTNFSREVYAICQHQQQGQRIPIALTTYTCEEFKTSWSAYIIIGYNKDETNKSFTSTFPTSTNNDGWSTTDDNVITDVPLTMTSESTDTTYVDTDSLVTTENITSSFVITDFTTNGSVTNDNSFSTNKTSNKELITGIIGGTAGGLVIIIFIAVVVCIAIRRSHQRIEKNLQIEIDNGTIDHYEQGPSDNFVSLNF